MKKPQAKTEAKSKRLPHGEAVFLKAHHLHGWWNSVVDDPRFVDVIAAVKRRRNERAQDREDRAGYILGFEKFEELMTEVCRSIDGSTAGELYHQVVDPDLDNSK